MDNRKKGEIVLRFTLEWLNRTTPGILEIRARRDGRVQVRDVLGWRDVGTVQAYAALARIQGKLPA